MRPDDFPKLIPMQLFKKIMCDGFNNNKGFSLIKIDIINLEYLKSIHGNSIIRLIHMAILDILNENTRKTGNGANLLI